MTSFSFLDKLKVSVLSIQNLSWDEKKKNSEIYIKVKFCKKNHKTSNKSVEENITWDFRETTFLFDLDETIASEKPPLQLVCYDKHRLQSNSFLGQATIPFESIEKQNPLDIWLTFGDSSTKVAPQDIAGKIHVRAELIYSTYDPNKPEDNLSEEKKIKIIKKFPDLPSTETILKYFDCSLWSNKNLLQGKMYISENYILFHSHVLNVKKKEMIKFSNIRLIGKKPTIMNNGIEITDLTTTYIFEGFTNRDAVLAYLDEIWSKTEAFKDRANYDPEQVSHRRSISANSSLILSSAAILANAKNKEKEKEEKIDPRLSHRRVRSLNVPTVDFKKFLPGHKNIKEQKIFGAPLQYVLERQRADGNQSDIPEIVQASINYLDNDEILDTEGIFRLSGSAVRLTELRNSVDRGDAINLNEVGDPHAITGLLKLYLRSLPEPLLTFELYDQFIQVQKDSTNPDYIEKLNSLIKSLPTENRNLLLHLLKFLKKVINHSNSNKMNISNLATVFAPNFIRNREDGSSVSLMNDISSFNELTQTLIEQCETFI